MNEVFNFTNRDILYHRCVLASIAHAIMVGEYSLLSSEQFWDDSNYIFTDMQGSKGVISFTEENFICTIQSQKNLYRGEKIDKLFYNIEKEIYILAQNEALQYMLFDDSLPAISLAFWGNKEKNYSNQLEKEILNLTDNFLYPYLSNEVEAKQYWIDYYEMSMEQIDFLKEIYELKCKNSGNLLLGKNYIKKLENWFKDIKECIESFSEINIYFNT